MTLADQANHLIIVARMAAPGALRYTPAGLPALDLQLEHESTQIEADTPRTVRLTIQAVALGELAQRLMSQDPNQPMRFEGFLVSPRLGKSVTFHVQHFKTV
ncbi:MAG: primosomal replication protein N [Alphaproteobacteria bacterium]|nr:primosomal replication protein N [Alphaproteobacteria bacterium]